MLWINKNKEPIELTEYKLGLTPYDLSKSGKQQYKEFCTNSLIKKAVQRSLMEEQNRFCCYCQMPLNQEVGTVSKLRIEHFYPKSEGRKGAKLSLDYLNLLGSCNLGGHPKKEEEQHEYSCDQKKGSTILSYIKNPGNSSKKDFYETMKIKHKMNGEISSLDDGVKKELEELNLNTNKLKYARAEVWDFIFSKFREMDVKLIDKKYKEFITRWRNGDAKMSLFSVYIFIIENKLLTSNPNYGKKFLNPHYI